jgi:hypothetical protein
MRLALIGEDAACGIADRNNNENADSLAHRLARTDGALLFLARTSYRTHYRRLGVRAQRVGEAA